jgi:hypothetical protein
MPTEDDLRAALTALERHAPAAARVLPGSSPRRRGLRSPQATRWLGGITTAAALAGLVTALTLPARTSGTSPNGGVASSAPITRATLQAKLLAAFSGAGDKIAVEHETDRVNSESPITRERWSYPVEPSVGQQVRIRDISIGQNFHEDDRESYLMPATQADLGSAKVQWTTVFPTGKTWSSGDSTARLGYVMRPVGPEVLANLPPLGKWTAHSTTLNGRPAIEFTLHTTSKAGNIESWSFDHLWVDASTYLPLRDTSDGGSTGFDTVTTIDYEYLPATPANLANLAPPIPAGFKRV